jgi:hypothetical protein
VPSSCQGAHETAYRFLPRACLHVLQSFQRQKKTKFTEGIYGPIKSELFTQSLVVEGQVPEELRGVYIRTGPNPQFDARGGYHWYAYFKKTSTYLRFLALLADEACRCHPSLGSLIWSAHQIWRLRWTIEIRCRFILDTPWRGDTAVSYLSGSMGKGWLMRSTSPTGRLKATTTTGSSHRTFCMKRQLDLTLERGCVLFRPY